VSKTFQITESVGLQFHAQYFNILNHTNFTVGTVTVAGAGFGQIRTASDPRIGQLALKVMF
jgi:hypothetical protein